MEWSFTASPKPIQMEKNTRIVMKQYTTPEQTAKLIELGLEKPGSIASVEPIYGMSGISVAKSYSIGELIEMLPRTIKLYYDLSIFSTSQGWWVLYGMIGDGDMWSIEHEVYRNNLVDALYEMIVKLKEGV